MRQHSSYLMSQIAQDFEFRARLGQWSIHPEAMTRQILTWTDGQPFLTYRLYRLVLGALEHGLSPDEFSLDWSPNTEGQNTEGQDVVEQSPLNSIARHRVADGSDLQSLPRQAAWVDGLVQAYCIERCTDPELLKHIRRVCKSVLDDARSLQLLELYRAVLDRSSIPGKDLGSLECRLIQIGLIKQTGSQLAVSNRLYRSIFDRAWLERAIKTLQSRKPVRSRPAHTSLSKGLPTLSIHRSTPLGWKQLQHQSSNQAFPNQASPLRPTHSLQPPAAMTASFPTDPSKPPSTHPEPISTSGELHTKSRPDSTPGLRPPRSAVFLGLALVACTLGAVVIAFMSYGSSEANPESVKEQLIRESK